MIARKLQSLEMFLRGVIAQKQPLTEFGMLHLAESISALIPLAEALEAHTPPARSPKVIAFRPRGDRYRIITDHDPGDAA